MKIWQLILKEIKFRKLNFTLIFFPVVVATSLCVMMLTVSHAAYKEINRQMRNLGTNLIIVPKSMNQFDYFKDGFTSDTLPEDYIEKLRKAKIFTVQHLIGTIDKPIDIKGKTAIVRGTMAAAQVAHAGKKAPMGTEVPLGKVFCGFAIAQQLNLEIGGALTIKDRNFIVDKIYRSKGNKEDVMIYMNLKEAQEIFEMPKKVNVIRALQCWKGRQNELFAVGRHDFADFRLHGGAQRVAGKWFGFVGADGGCGKKGMCKEWTWFAEYANGAEPVMNFAIDIPCFFDGFSIFPAYGVPIKNGAGHAWSVTLNYGFKF